MKKLIMIAALTTLLSAHALAAGGYNGHFGNMDTDRDGLVTRAEFTAFFPDNEDAPEVFAQADKDGSGALDHDEWHEFKDAHGYGHADGPGHGKERQSD